MITFLLKSPPMPIFPECSDEDVKILAVNSAVHLIEQLALTAYFNGTSSFHIRWFAHSWA